MDSSDYSGELELWSGHPSWRGMIGYYVKWQGLALALSVGCVYAWRHGMLGGGQLLLALLLLNGAVLAAGRLRRAWITYTVSSEQLCDRRFSWKLPWPELTDEHAPLSRIQNISIRQSIIDKLFRVGTCDVNTAGEYPGDRNLFLWWGVHRPQEVRAVILRAMNECREREERGSEDGVSAWR